MLDGFALVELWYECWLVGLVWLLVGFGPVGPWIECWLVGLGLVLLLVGVDPVLANLMLPASFTHCPLSPLKFNIIRQRGNYILLLNLKCLLHMREHIHE